MAYRSDSSSTEELENSRHRRELSKRGREIRTQIRELDNQLELLCKLQDEQSDSQTEGRYQTDRLRALDLLVPKSALTDGDVDICPLCDQNLDYSDETIDELRVLLNSLETRLEASNGVSSRRQAIIERLEARREPLVEELRENVIELDAVAQQEAAIAAGRERRERIAFLQGRVSQELERGVDIVADLTELRNAERLYRLQLDRLEDISERDDPAAALRVGIDSVSELMTDYARYLHLEGSKHYVRLDPVELTVSIQRPGGRIPLSRMGSAENWIGYHLVAHLALHNWFVTNNRPVPRFLMFDQPSQAFFPEEIVDAAEDENADWEAVRRQFALMRDVVVELAGKLQVIVCDHANLADGWFQDAVIGNWRNGVALIPTDWLDEEAG
ncbi:DUF3732 domain-containing protein [Rothia sp. CCM 9419]|uniref:DUF3732 domain-containing protein n=1 Tax=Rothia sp. CCM 9419 TaxID=3402662 RepID=UPI003ADE52F2